jgi:hypothetical protein
MPNRLLWFEMAKSFQTYEVEHRDVYTLSQGLGTGKVAGRFSSRTDYLKEMTSATQSRWSAGNEPSDVRVETRPVIGMDGREVRL